MRITELAAQLGCEIRNLTQDFEVVSLTTLEKARPGDVSFISSDKYVTAAASTAASALIIPAGLASKGMENFPPGMALLPLSEPWAGVLTLLQHLHPDAGKPDVEPGIHPSAVIDETADIALTASIGALAVIGPRVVVSGGAVIGPGCVVGRDSRIGRECVLHPNSVLQEGTVLGDRVILQPGAVLGADGFKYEVLQGRWTKIPQVGHVEVGDDAEIGANTCVDRASFTETVVGANSKIDNLVQIAHNVRIGSNCIIVSQTGIAGSTEIGDGTILAAQVGIADNIKLGNRTVVLARSAVKDNVEDGQTVFGTPARPFRQAAKIIAAEAKLPDLIKEVDRLRARLEALETKAQE